MAFGNTSTIPSFCWDAFVDCAFIVDVGVQFITGGFAFFVNPSLASLSLASLYCHAPPHAGYYDGENILQTSHGKIAKRYLKGWFMVDAVGSLPVDLGLMPYLGQGAIVTRVCRVVRFYRYVRYFEERGGDANFASPTLIRLINTVLFNIFFWHLVACAYWYIGKVEGCGTSAWLLPQSALEESLVLQYTQVMVWSIGVTFAYQTQAQPQTILEGIFTLLVVPLGVAMNAVVIGSASSALQSLDAERQARRQRMDKINNYMNRRKIPPYFRQIVVDYYSYMAERASEDGVLSELPPSIQGRLQLLLNRDLVRTIPLLRSLDLHVIVTLMQALEARIFLPGEFVFRCGEKGSSLYLVKSGKSGSSVGCRSGMMMGLTLIVVTPVPPLLCPQAFSICCSATARPSLDGVPRATSWVRSLSWPIARTSSAFVPASTPRL